MRKVIFFLGVLGLFSLTSCHNHSKEHGHSHAEEAGHDHSKENTHGACDHDHDHGHDHASPAKQQEDPGYDEIVLSEEKAEAAGVASKIIQPGNFREVIKTGGQVIAAQGDEAVAVATVSGIVSFRNKMVEGMSIGKGHPLATVSARNLLDGDPTQKAKIAYETAKKEYERMQPLAESRIVSEKDFMQAKQNYDNARVSYEAIARNHTPDGQNITAPIAGYVKSILAREGDYVEVGQPLVSVTQNRKMYLRAEASGKYYSSLKNISSANFKSPYSEEVYQLAELGGRLLSYGKSPGDNSYHVPVTFEFENKVDIIPGTFVEIYLLSTPLNNVISVPHTAITEEQGNYFVYVQLDGECYKKQRIEPGGHDGVNVQVLSGIKPGDRVVTEGAYQVKLASASNVLPAHSHEH